MCHISFQFILLSGSVLICLAPKFFALPEIFDCGLLDLLQLKVPTLIHQMKFLCRPLMVGASAFGMAECNRSNSIKFEGGL